jgi:hypothetical protein
MSRKDRQKNAEQKVAQCVGTISSSDNILRKAKDLWRASPQDHTVIMRAFIKVCRGRSMTEAEIADLVRQLDPEPIRSAPAPRLGLAVDMATTFGSDGGERVKGRGARRARDN